MKKIFLAIVAIAGLTFTSCDLDEYNPSAGDASLTAYSAWAGLQAYCYSCLADELYTASDWMFASEGGTDCWVAKNNGTGSKDLFYYEDMTPSTNATKKLFKQCYSMLTTCNTVINEAANITIDRNEELIPILVAETKTLRAFYYYLLVSNFGPVTLTLDSNASVSGVVERHPKRSSEKDIYDQIIKDLTEAVEVLPVTAFDGNKARVTKKAAMGILARVYAQRAGLGDSKFGDGQSYWQLCYETAKDLIDNAGTYGAYLYDDVYDTWADANNRNNEEALFIAAGLDANGESSQYGSWRNKLSAYSSADAGACAEFWNSNHKPSDKGYYYGRHNASTWMPTKYLMYCFDPTWDKRWEASWQYAYGEWSMVQCGWVAFNKGCITLTEAICTKYGIDLSNVGKVIIPLADCHGIASSFAGNQFPAKIWKKGTTAETATVDNLLHVDDPEWGTRKAYSVPYPVAADDNRFNIVSVHTDAELQVYKDGKSQFFAFKLADLYGTDDLPYGTVDQGSDAAKAPVGGQDPETGAYLTNAHRAYPSLTKFNWSYEGVFTSSNLQVKGGDMFIMRMAEVYLLAAEAAEMLGKGGEAATYLNVLRKRAAREGVAESVWKLSTATEDDVLDEYAREMCGEFSRWALLKRHNNIKERLEKYNKRAAKSFKPHHYNRAISIDFLQTILNAEEYGDNGYGATAKSGLEGFE